MKEYHAINILEGIHEDYVKDSDKEYMEKNLALTEAVKALSEIQQYRAIGTVEEIRKLKESNLSGLELAEIAVAVRILKEYKAIGTVEECWQARERQRAKKPKSINRVDEETIYMRCANCGLTTVLYRGMEPDYCPKCGQAIDWDRRQEDENNA